MNNFLTQFHKENIVDELKIGDKVLIIGKDEFKGWAGIIIQYKRLSGEDIFTIELNANNKRVERLKSQLRKELLK